jgi:hypothetical protein
MLVGLVRTSVFFPFFSAINSVICTGDESAVLGTLSLITGRPMRMDTLLPDWLENGVESSLRDTEEETAPALAPQPIMAGQRNKGTASPIVLTPSGEPSPVGSQTRGGGPKGAWMDLDKFYADTGEAEEGGDSDGEEEEEDDDEDDEEEDDEEEDDEDEVEDEDEDGQSEEEDKEHSDSGEEPGDSQGHHSEEENHIERQAFAAGTHLDLS